MAGTRKETAYTYLLHRLFDGTYQPNQRLVPAVLAKEIGVSQVPVREAIGQLQSEGLVVQAPRHGVFVRQMDRQELVELIELRRVLECNAAAQAARRVTPDGLRDLKKCVHDLHDRYLFCANVADDQQRMSSARNWMYADLNFHMAILRAAQNEPVIKALREANVLTRMFGYRTDIPMSWKDPTFLAVNFAVHRKVYMAIRDRNPKAARRAMDVHMSRSEKNILARFEWLQKQMSVRERRSGEFPDSMRKIIDEIQDQ
jgi:DNA-binding GntR family transcriptional regulator